MSKQVRLEALQLAAGLGQPSTDTILIAEQYAEYIETGKIPRQRRKPKQQEISDAERQVD